MQVSAGAAHSCGVTTDGRALCWGSGDWGQTSPPADVFSQVSAGVLHSCGISGVRTLCWGNDAEGQSSPPPAD